MIINRREDPKNMWKIGEMETSICTDYNYLGQIVQSNGSLDKHLEQKEILQLIKLEISNV